MDHVPRGRGSIEETPGAFQHQGRQQELSISPVGKKQSIISTMGRKGDRAIRTTTPEDRLKKKEMGNMRVLGGCWAEDLSAKSRRKAGR